MPHKAPKMCEIVILATGFWEIKVSGLFDNSGISISNSRTFEF